LTESIARARAEFLSAVRPVGGLRAARAIGRDIAASLAGIWRRKARVKARVAEEYDQGYWSDVQRERAWLRFPDLEAYLLERGDTPRTCRVGSTLVQVPTREYYRFRARMLRLVLREFADDVDELAEIGSGYGYNVLTLSLDSRWRRLRGFDISDVGVATAREIAAHYGLAERLEFHRLDLTDAADAAFRDLRGATVFSYYCFEQLPAHTSVVVENLLRAGVSRVIHIEPAVEFLRWTSVLDWASYLYIIRSDYQRTLLSTLRRFEREGRLKILHSERLEFAPGIHHDPALICWAPVVR
jgi:hypothetical protein